MEADGMRILALGRRAPFAADEHRGLVVLLHRVVAGGAVIPRRLRRTLLPDQPLEAQPLHLATRRARHEEAPLVGGQVLPLDPAAARDGRRADQEGLAPPAEGPRPRLGQRDRIALAGDVAGIGVHLVEEQEPRRHRAQPDRAVGPGQHQDAAGEFLRQHGVAAVACAGRCHPLPQRRCFLQQRVNALAREALGQFHGRLHRQRGRRHVMHDVAEPVVAALRRSDLSALHEHDAPGGMHRRQRVHHVLQVGRAAGAPGARFRRGAAAQHAVPLGPFRHRELRRRAEHGADTPAHMLTAAKTGPLRGLRDRSDRPPPSAGR